MRCTKAGCETENPDGAKFCKKCRTALAEPVGGDQTAASAQPAAPPVQPAAPPVQPAASSAQPAAPPVQPAASSAQPAAPPTQSAPAKVLAAVRWLLLLEPRRRGWSYLVVGLFYVVVFFGLALVFEGEAADDPDYTSVGSDIAVALVSIVIARLFAGLLIAWLEREPASEGT